jgi:hypothetical protein
MFGKKGQAITFGNAPRIVLLFVLIGMVLGAGVISLTSFRNSVTDVDAETALNNTIEGSTNLSLQLPTVGTMLGVGLILTVVIGVFAFFAQKGA